MKLKTISYITLLLFSCQAVQTRGQTVKTSGQTNQAAGHTNALKIGEQFNAPKKVQVMRGDGKSINWKTLENKVVLLDFFDTYCSTCIASMPHLQKLQDNYPDKLQIINVTWQDKATLDKFFTSNAYLKENKVNLPVVYNDTYFRNLFPYQAAPHIVMLFKGKVQAITFNRLATAENILQLYKKGTVNLPFKDDFGKGDLKDQWSPSGNRHIKAGVWLTGYQDGVPGQVLTFKKDSLTGNYKSSVYNRSVLRTLLNTWTKIRKPDFIVSDQRIDWKVKDRTKYEDQSNKGEAWSSEHAICYERMDLVQRPDSIQAGLVLHDLHSLLGIKSYWAYKTMKCLILQSCPIREPAGKTEDKRKTTYEGTAVLSTFIDMSAMFPPVADKVNKAALIKIGDYKNLAELNEQLGQYGIEAIIGDESIEVFVIEEAGN